MKQVLLLVCCFMLVFSLAACGSNAETPPSSEDAAASSDTGEQTNAGSTIQITTEEGDVIVFALNDSTAAKQLFAQLPLSVQVEDYGSSEKLFYPPKKLDTSDAPLANGPAGTLAYYEPWGDVVIFYREFDESNGLYELGAVVSGGEHSSELAGEIRIEAVGGATASSNPAGSEGTGGPQKTQSGDNTGLPSSDATSEARQPLPKASDASPGAADSPSQAPSSNHTGSTTTEANKATKMLLHIGNRTFTATLEENAAVDSFVTMMENAPVVIQMSDYAGFEKVGPLGASLPTSNSQTTTESGDIVLYNGDQIVLFYGSNSWSYTKLATIDDLSGWKEALGSEEIQVTFTVAP